MSNSLNAKYAAYSSRAERVESEVEAAQQFSSTRGVALLLLSALAAAVISVAYEVMDTETEGHLLVMWMGLWAVLFGLLAVFASTARSLALRLKTSLDAWSHRQAQARADQRLWAMAQKDERLMADLKMAMLRSEAQVEERAARAGRALKAGLSA